jgi:hypothetical protein
MRRIFVRLLPMLALVAGLSLAGGPHASAAKATSAIGTGSAQPFDVWCC